MTLIELYHLKCNVIKILSKMDLDSIFAVMEEFKKKHPDDCKDYDDVFTVAINRKYEELSLKEILCIAEQFKNAPSSAATPEQGK